MKNALSIILLASCFISTPNCVEPIGKHEDGGVVPSEGRERVNEFFGKLKKTKTIDEETKALKEFTEWLNANGYKIEIEAFGDSHRLACPYFPPVTPWMDYRFRSIENMKIIPHRTRPS